MPRRETVGSGVEGVQATMHEKPRKEDVKPTEIKTYKMDITKQSRG